MVFFVPVKVNSCHVSARANLPEKRRLRSASFLIESVHLQKNHFNKGDSGSRMKMDAMQTGITLSSYETPRSTPVILYV